MMDKRKSFVFARRQYRITSLEGLMLWCPEINNQNGHWHGDARFSWLQDNDLPLDCRRCLFLTCSYRDNPYFFTQYNIGDLF